MLHTLHKIQSFNQYLYLGDNNMKSVVVYMQNAQY